MIERRTIPSGGDQSSRAAVLEVCGLAKTFTLHTQNGVKLPVFEGVGFAVEPGECLVLTGQSGAGKSTLLRSLYANYKPSAGTVKVWHAGAWVELVSALPRVVLEVRRQTLGYVSQFLRVIPRVSTLDVVCEGLSGRNPNDGRARDRAARLLERLRLPERLWDLPPATFSGGEQQRVNIARCFVHGFPLLLLDEPTASLDPANRDVVIELINEAKMAGTAIVGIFHDPIVRSAVGTQELGLDRFKPARLAT